MIDNIFNKRETIDIDYLNNFKDELDYELFKFEFNSFHVKEDKITGQDFAKSMMCYLEPKIAYKYIKQLENECFPGTVSFDEYANFQRFMIDNYSLLEKEIESRG